MARRRRRNGADAVEGFAKGFTDSFGAVSRAIYYGELAKKAREERERAAKAPSNDKVEEYAKNYKGGANGGAGSNGGKALTSNERMAAARDRMDYLINEKKVPPHVAAAMVGNIAGEGGFRPEIWGDNNASYGNYQFNKKGELPAFLKWADENRRDIKDPRSQDDFVIQRLQKDYPEVWKKMVESGDAGKATVVMTRGYERPKPETANEAGRVGFATSALKGHQELTANRAKSEQRYKEGAVDAKPLDSEVPPAEKKQEDTAAPAAAAPAARPPMMTRAPAPVMGAGMKAPGVDVELPPEVASPTEKDIPVDKNDISYEGAIDTGYKNPKVAYDNPTSATMANRSPDVYGAIDGRATRDQADLYPQLAVGPKTYEMPSEAWLEENDTPEDAQVVEDDALGLGYGRGNVALYSATGGPVPEIEQEPGLDHAIASALHGVQGAFGLGEENAALPGSDPERQGNISAFARNEGAMTPAEMQKVVQTIDPEGKLSRDQANSVALEKLYGYYAKKEGPEAAQDAASSFVQGARAQSMKMGSLAIAALENGDMQGAGKALIESYNQIPDGKTVSGQVGPDGNGMAVIKDSKTGKTVQQMRLSPQLLKIAASKLADGSEFYSHLARHAAPGSRPAQHMRGGGVAGDPWGPMPGESYDDPNEQLDADAALLTSSTTRESDSNSDSDSGGGDGDGAETAVPVASRMAIPKQPETIPYLPNMTSDQRKYIDRVNGARQAEWKASVAAHQKTITDEVIRRRGEAALDRRQAFTEDQSNKRMAFTEGQTTTRMQQQEKMQSDRQAEADRQARIREQERQAHEVRQNERGLYNGMTVADMRNETNEANKPIISSIQDLTAQAVNPNYREAALPMGGEAPAIDGELRMPEGTNTPRTGEEAQRAVSGAFDREFALMPGDKARAIQTRAGLDEAIKERDFTAADVGARAYAKDRPGLEKAVDEVFDDKNEGLFTRNLKDGEKVPKGEVLQESGRLYFGHKVTPQEKATLKTFAFKLARANPDLPISSAAQTVMRLTSIDAQNPDATANFSVKIDPKTGAGRVVLKEKDPETGKPVDGLAFNLDSESLKQVLQFRQAKAFQQKGRLAAEAGEKEKSDLFWKQAGELAGAIADKASELGGSFWDEAIVKNPVIGGPARAIGGAAADAGRYVGKKFVDTYSDPNAKPVDSDTWNDPSGYGAIPIYPR